MRIIAPLTTATPKHKTEKTPSPLMPSMTTGEIVFMLCSDFFRLRPGQVIFGSRPFTNTFIHI